LRELVLIYFVVPQFYRLLVSNVIINFTNTKRWNEYIKWEISN